LQARLSAVGRPRLGRGDHRQRHGVIEGAGAAKRRAEARR
jgi:hypothetical protein